LIYNISQSFQNYTKLTNFLSSANIIGDGAKIKTLTFNETVGTVTGCYMKNADGKLTSLILGSTTSCIHNDSITTSLKDDVSSSLAIGVAIGVLSSVVIVIAILMIIPGTRNAIFPKRAIRKDIKKRTENQE